VLYFFCSVFLFLRLCLVSSLARGDRSCRSPLRAACAAAVSDGAHLSPRDEEERLVARPRRAWRLPLRWAGHAARHLDGQLSSSPHQRGGSPEP
jgi:hypothetical protein